MPLINLAGLWSQKRLYVFVHIALKCLLQNKHIQDYVLSSKGQLVVVLSLFLESTILLMCKCQQYQHYKSLVCYYLMG